MRWIMNIFCAFIFCHTVSGCASIVQGPKQEITISTYPAGATVCAGEECYVTPATIVLPRKSAHLLTISKSGYQQKKVQLEQEVSAAVIGNALLPGGIIGWGIDSSTGAQWKLVPEEVDVELYPAAQPPIIAIDCK